MIVSFIFFPEYKESYYTIPVIPLILGSTFYLILGVLDDLYTFSARKKLIWQSILAITSVFLGLRFTFFNIPLLDFIFTVLWIVIIVNAVNLTDVCDGLVSGLCIIIFIIPTFLILLSFVWGYYIQCYNGFLFFNFPKASIF